MDEITDIIQIKNEVLKKVCEYAYEGTLEEHVDQIPFEIIKGITPRFRCCVYREREIIRQRVRLAMGKLPADSVYTDLAPSQVVHVIPCACEGCPIARYTVTDNCQSCLAQKCIKACRFGAIYKTPKGAVIDPKKCKKCGKCYEACPYHAIVDMERPCKRACPVNAISIDDNDIAIIDKKKCINCGACVVGCPFGAISDLSMVANVIKEILDPSVRVYAIIAPAVEGQFGQDISLGKIMAATKLLGFDDVYEVALGADAVAYNESQELLERYETGEKMTSSCCHSFVNLIEQHFPDLKPYVSTTVPPMVAAAQYVKSLDPEGIVVFIGPCITKKSDVLSHYIDQIQYVLTFEELLAMFQTKQINPAQMEISAEEDATSYGKGFAKSGGVAAAVLRAIDELGETPELNVVRCNGVQECMKTLRLLKAGRLSEDFIEGMGCVGGCIAGPASIKEPAEVRRGFDKFADNNNHNIIATNKEKKLDQLHLHQH